VTLSASAQGNEGPRTLLWFAAFLLLSSALIGAEIRSEALTLGAASHRLEAASAIPPDLVVTSRSTADLGPAGAFSADKD
jgi:hypothetical protein